MVGYRVNFTFTFTFTFTAAEPNNRWNYIPGKYYFFSVFKKKVLLQISGW